SMRSIFSSVRRAASRCAASEFRPAPARDSARETARESFFDSTFSFRLKREKTNVRLPMLGAENAGAVVLAPECRSRIAPEIAAKSRGGGRASVARGLRSARAESVAVELLAQLAALLRLERKRGGGPREQARNADRLAGFLAVAVLAAVDAGERLLHLLQQLALAIARAQLQRVFFLDCRAIGRIGHDDGFPQVFRRFVGVGKDVPLD